MARRYQPIWQKIKEVAVGKQVPVRVHESAVTTLIQAVKKEKSMEVAEKKKLGMRHAGTLQIERIPDKQKPGFVIVKFSLDWDGNKL